MIGLVRAAGHDRDAATLIRVLLAEEILKPVASGLEVAEADLRAELALSQVQGLVLGRHVIGLETRRLDARPFQGPAPFSPDPRAP